ncbi:uncharacterized protein LOC134527710 isoform X1 [Bacillus rossius redtenbacheri]|uniref:uncharacterized protein LOC134527710 isoform X1 n=1 Tax=Bacillus rossius redtenbacheri TaxID=93214 RepID=UPI002FDD1D28
MARKSRGKISFQSDWKNEFPWAEEVKGDRHSAKCSLCNTTFSILSMGRTAVVSHSKGAKHVSKCKSIQKSAPINSWAVSATSSSSAGNPEELTSVSGVLSSKLCESSTLGVSTSSNVSSNVVSSVTAKTQLVSHRFDKYLQKDEVTSAEALWCMQNVMNHDSLRGAASSVCLFRKMFPIDPIANNMQLQKDKISYVIVYGLAPYFDTHLKTTLQGCDHFVLSFDESMNKVAQKQQMDLFLRFWDTKINQVTSRYLTSVFLFHTTGEYILDAIKAGLDGLSLNKVIQLSMDGPNVNAKVARLLKELRSEPGSPQLLDIGTCGLHTVHNAFKTGIRMTGWEIIEFCRALYNLFKEAPGRRGDYVKASNSNVFPLKVCAVRWIENSKVTQRAREILPNVQKYILSVKGTGRVMQQLFTCEQDVD